MAPETLHNGAPRAQPTAADGSPRLPHVAYDDDGYPYADGAPLAQNSPQCDQIIYAFPALRALLRRRFPGAFAASDMLVYPQKGDLAASVAPDVFVAFGAGDHARNSYKLWEGEPVPAFVLEVLSGTTSDNDLGPKRDAYARMGVRELWLFDPFAKRIAGHIAGFRLNSERLGADQAAAGQRRLPERRARPGATRRGRRSAHPRPVAGEDLLGYEEGAGRTPGGTSASAGGRGGGRTPEGNAQPPAGRLALLRKRPFLQLSQVFGRRLRLGCRAEAFIRVLL